MSSRHSGLLSAVSRQFRYRLLEYSGILCGIAVLQLAAAAMTVFGGSGTFSVLGSSLTVSYRTAAPGALWFTGVLGAAVLALSCARPDARNEAATLPGCRLADTLADSLLLFSADVYGGLLTALLDAAMRLPALLLYRGGVLFQGYYPTAGGFFALCTETFLAMLGCSSLFYFGATLAHFSRIWGILLPVLAAGVLFLHNRLPLFHILWMLLFGSVSAPGMALRYVPLSLALFAFCAVFAKRREVIRV